MNTLFKSRKIIASPKFLFCACFLIGPVFSSIFGLVENRSANLLVGALAAICLVVMVAFEKEYQIKENEIIQRAPISLGRSVQTNSWVNVSAILIIKVPGESISSLLVKFKQGRDWEIEIEEPNKRLAVLEHARRLNISVVGD